ncbi:DeoR family transcriptional regulator [Dactylosporangium sp. NPDC051541]|uniref:DeoR family transcriptional regulator n=1 Tax=Dactylosporangium sp. NPDC051541 TaxID=3363977 RepID=UPI0037B891D1
MIIERRRSEILAAARRSGGVGLRELSKLFHVSIPTIRRDLSALAERGLLQRVHGGAVPLDDGRVDAPAALVEPGMAIGIAGRRLGPRLAARVSDVPGLTVVTPMLVVARAVRGEVLIVGGVRTPSGSHAGPVAELTLRSLHLDIAFVEPGPLGDVLAAATDQALLARARRQVLL